MTTLTKEKVHTVVKVPVWEYERGWGSKIDDWMLCLTSEDAENFVEEFNSQNKEDSAPDWYMKADNTPMPQTITDIQFRKLKKSKNKRAWLSTIKS